MKRLTEKGIKNQLKEIINKNKIEQVIFEPRYFESPVLPTFNHKNKDVIGAIITIITLNRKGSCK
jgi:hypothetical protein